MLSLPPSPAPLRRELVPALLVFGLALCFNFWGAQVGWRSLNLPGHEFRQAQTALSAEQINATHDFSLDYATPVLGKPWAIPLEFPLYQWTVVKTGDWTGLDLIKSGRVVSLICFYLLLPAIYLLLGNRGVAPGRRWLVLALVLTSPLYIFYSRAFLIETMALMFSLWFWLAYEKAVGHRDWRWLVLANLAGTGAGLVKVTTLLLYLLPAAAWALRRLWLARQDSRGRAELPWMIAAVAVPLAATLWWAHHAEAVRGLNPLAHFLSAQNLQEFTLGTWTTRLSPELWRQKWESTTYSVTWWPVLAAGLTIGLLSSRVRLGQSLLWVGYFLAALVIFPVLYGFHDYYFVANGVLLLMALGLILVGVAETTRRPWLPALLALGLAGAQGWRYHEGYYQTQRGLSEGGDSLTLSLRTLVQADEVVVVVGQQWNPMLPFYAQRRAMMIREEEERNPARLDAAFTAMAGERAGALLLSDSVRDRAEFLRRTAPLGISNQPIFRWRDVTVYLRDDRRDESIRQLQKESYPEVALTPGVEPQPDRLASYWVEVAGLPPAQLELFAGLNPRPVRFFSSYGPGVEYQGERWVFGAHPVTRLVFALPAGKHYLRTSVSMALDTYAGAQPPDQRTDGVEINLIALTANRPGRVLFTRLFNPRDNPGDRGVCPLEISFTLDQAGEVELSFGPGPAGRDTYDSILIDRLEIQ